MLKTKTKNLRPIDIDGHFKYRCPSCGIDHWASFKEASTKNFIIVCDCSQTFTIKRMVDIQIIFAKKKNIEKSKEEEAKTKVEEKTSVVRKTIESVNIPNKTLEKASKMLVALGFMKNEADSMLREEYARNPTEDVALLVKNTIGKIGGSNV